jgi:VWFA-related protein
MARTIKALGVFLAALNACLLLGQENPRFRGESQIVVIPALVKAADGHTVYGLQAEDFIVEDDGVEQAVQLDQSADSAPASIVVAVQTGRRAKREFSRLGRLGAMLDDIIAEGPATSEITVVEFDSRVRAVRGFNHDDPPVADYLSNLSPGDHGAAILDAVNYSVRLLSNLPKDHERMLLLISETRDHGSHKTQIQDLIEAVGRTDVLMYTLVFSPSLSQVLDTERGLNRDEWRPAQAPLDVGGPLFMTINAMRRNTAQSLASMTGGEYELFATSKTFEDHMFDFTNHLHNRYVLSFQPKHPHPGLHQLSVRMRNGSNHWTVLARTSYWAQN